MEVILLSARQEKIVLLNCESRDRGQNSCRDEISTKKMTGNYSLRNRTWQNRRLLFCMAGREAFYILFNTTQLQKESCIRVGICKFTQVNATENMLETVYSKIFF